MVILIGGVSCTGKTAMAQKLLEIHQYPYLSIDHLKMGLFRGTADCQFTPEDDDKIIAEHLWPIIKGIIMTNIENRQNIIIEGCYLMPDKIIDFDDEYIDEIISFYIGFSENYISKKYTSNIVSQANIIEARGSDAITPASQLITKHAGQKALCHAHNARYFEIDNDYFIEIDKIYQWVNDEIIQRRK